MTSQGYHMSIIPTELLANANRSCREYAYRLYAHLHPNHLKTKSIRRVEKQELERRRVAAEQQNVDMICYYCEEVISDMATFMLPSTTGRREYMCGGCFDNHEPGGNYRTTRMLLIKLNHAIVRVYNVLRLLYLQR